MTYYMGKHTYCYKCGLPVKPDVLHYCTKTNPFIPKNINTFWCAHCQAHIVIPEGHKRPYCKGCNTLLHSGISNPVETVVHEFRERTDPVSSSYRDRTTDITISFTEHRNPTSSASYSGYSPSIGSYNRSSHSYVNQRASDIEYLRASMESRTYGSTPYPQSIGTQTSSSNCGASFIPHTGGSYW
uniref:Uncharacterized protein n=1 Tax=Borely moumouvirus TaxID=2712067 RepID=A0A6G6AE53_9VIRU